MQKVSLQLRQQLGAGDCHLVHRTPQLAVSASYLI
uniref:Uncharacterized protein n=1 Tax=Arundo donax TaxID=35708 RepID=A0A0A9AG51_ARUDO